jgi:hypothetical protein
MPRRLTGGRERTAGEMARAIPAQRKGLWIERVPSKDRPANGTSASMAGLLNDS